MLKTKKNVCRVPRSDKGIVRVTERDIRILHWSAKQCALQFDQVKYLLSRAASEGVKKGQKDNGYV